jgi:hypothetical protein
MSTADRFAVDNDANRRANRRTLMLLGAIAVAFYFGIMIILSLR